MCMAYKMVRKIKSKEVKNWSLRLYSLKNRSKPASLYFRNSELELLVKKTVITRIGTGVIYVNSMTITVKL